jgi:RNA recognition motif-containing protein
MPESDSEESRHGARAEPKEEVDGVPAPEGAVITHRQKGAEKEIAPKPEPQDDTSSNKPSFTLHFKGLPEDTDVSDLEMRLKRHGKVLSIDKADGMYVIKFSKTTEAYAAREKFNGYVFNGSSLQVDFGPQADDHYQRKGQTRLQGRGHKEFEDGERMNFEVEPPPPRPSKPNARGMRAWGGDEPPAKRQRTAPSDGTQKDAGERAVGSLIAPGKPVSRWNEKLRFEEQLEDFMKMPRKGMYNRYLVIGKLPPELRTREAIWRMVAPVQRDIVHVEMLTCFGKPVAHVALRNATGASTMHRLAEQMLPHLTVAFAPPRRASPTLWLGNIDDYVQRKDLEDLLDTFGKIPNGMRYVPARTCAFVTFEEVEDAVRARNTLYGIEVLKNQYLNVDFTDESMIPPEDFGPWGPWNARGAGFMPPWGGDPRASLGMYSDFYRQQGRKGDRSPQRGDKPRRRERSRTPPQRQASPERARRHAREASPSPRKSPTP